jgi:predicted permease
MRMVWLDQLFQQVRDALRRLIKAPVFTILTLALLTLAMTAFTSVFTLLDQVVLRKLPVKDPDALVFVTRWKEKTVLHWSSPLFQDLRREQRVFEDLLATADVPNSPIRLPGRGQSMLGSRACLVTRNYFRVLGVEAMKGRTFVEDAAAVSESFAVVVSYRFWERHLGKREDIIGEQLALNDVPLTIVGVMPPAFIGDTLGNPTDLWVPLAAVGQIIPGREKLLGSRGDGWLTAIGRLRQGTSLEQARTHANLLLPGLMTEADLLGRRETERLSDYRIELEPGGRGRDTIRGRLTQPLTVLFAVVTAVLLLVCANVSGLLLARTADRERELAIRAALGAKRGVLLGQLVTDSLMLGLAAGIAALVLAPTVIRLLLRLASQMFPMVILERGIQGKTLGVTLAMALLAGVFCTLLPATYGMRLLGASFLRARQSAGVTRRRFSRGLLAFQFTLCTALLVPTGALLQHLQDLSNVDTGYDRAHLLNIRIDATSSGPRSTPEWINLHDTLLERLDAHAQVDSVAASQCALLTPCKNSVYILVAGRPERPGHSDVVRLLTVSPNYVQTLGMRLIAGREFSGRDRSGAPQVAIVNDTFARYFFPGESAVGKRIGYRASPTASTDPHPIEIVGVVEDARYDATPEPVQMLIRPFHQDPGPIRSLDVRTAGEPGRLIREVRQAVRAAAPRVTIIDSKPLDERLGETVVRERIIGRIGGSLGLLGLLLAVAGLFGAMSHAVVTRTSEIGIRIALGATPERIARLLLLETFIVLAIGVAVGVPAALLGMNSLTSVFVGIAPRNVLLVVGIVVTLLCATALGASYVPARRASRKDPSCILRHE